MTPKILLMSDIHITEAGTDIVGLDPQSRFQRCLDHAARHHGDASHLYLMGDLTHHGTQAEYEILREILSAQPFPLTLMLCNHDCRGPFAQVFPEQSATFQQGHRFWRNPHPISRHVRRERPRQAQWPDVLGSHKLVAGTA